MTNPTKDHTRISKSKQLELSLTHFFPTGFKLKITNNKRSVLARHGTYDLPKLHIHQIFLDGDLEIYTALGQYLQNGCVQSGQKIDQYIQAKKHLIQGPVAQKTGEYKGRYYNLQERYQIINKAYFDDALKCDIFWGRKAHKRTFSRTKRRSILLGSYRAANQSISIHPLLDQQFIPQYALDFVIFHEMLHAFLPKETSKSGRCLSHGPVFKESEAHFVYFEAAETWFKDNLSQLLSD